MPSFQNEDNLCLGVADTHFQGWVNIWIPRAHACKWLEIEIVGSDSIMRWSSYKLQI